MAERLAVPLHLNPDGTIATITQGSDDDVAQCLLATGRTIPGSRWDAPNLGVTLEEFGELPLDLTDLTAALVRGEPRRPIDVVQSTHMLDAATRTVAAELTITYGQEPTSA